MIDLHTHTYYSDGRYSPGEVVAGAKKRGVRVLAITDHDNLRGSLEAAPLAQQAGIELVPAIELTTRWPGMDLSPQDANVDLLGYFVNPQDPVFRAFCDASLNDLHERIGAACARLTEQGHPLSMADVFAENPRYGGAMQGIFALIHKGLAPNWESAARLFDSAWLSGRETPFTIRAAIEQIHLAGGVAVLAHPSIVRPHRQPLTVNDLRQLVDAGLDGIEIYHHRLDAAAQTYFLGLARILGLLVTGGTDMHGWSHGLEELGKQPVTDKMLEALRAKSNHRSGG